MSPLRRFRKPRWKTEKEKKMNSTEIDWETFSDIIENIETRNGG
jgi:hypothetical protein